MAKLSIPSVDHTRRQAISLVASFAIALALVKYAAVRRSAGQTIR